jgi:hypothetical protein
MAGPIEVAPKYLFCPCSAFFFFSARLSLSSQQPARKLPIRCNANARLCDCSFWRFRSFPEPLLLGFPSWRSSAHLLCSASSFSFPSFPPTPAASSLASHPIPALSYGVPVHKTRKEVLGHLGSSVSLVSCCRISFSPNLAPFFSFPLPPHLFSVFLFTFL